MIRNLGHIARLVTHYALAHPEIRFTLESEGRVLIDAVAVNGMQERIYQIFGDGFLDNLVEISGQAGSVRVHGFCSRPHEQRTNPYSQFFYVNRRMVRDKVLDERYPAGISQLHSRFRLPGGDSVCGIAVRSGGCQCSSGQNGDSIPGPKHRAQTGSRIYRAGSDIRAPRFPCMNMDPKEDAMPQYPTTSPLDS